VLHGFFVVAYETILQMLFCLPRFKIFNLFKSFFLTLCGAKIGKRVIFYPGVWIAPGRWLVVGDDVDFALDVIVTTGGGVHIGNRVLIGYRTQILSTNHIIPNNHHRIFEAGHEKKQVIIGDDVWIGANCIIVPGIEIGEGAVVAASSVVTKSVEPFTVVGGVPAKKIRDRN